jgi:hypothetical protein
MRLSEWRRAAPHRDSMTPKVVAVVESVLGTMGADPDPECWVAWGDDPSVRYTVLTPTAAGLLVVHCRVNVPGEGPRAAAKLVRWPRVQFGELAIETQGGRRLLAFQVEGQILRGMDAEAEQIAAFALQLLAAADGRPVESSPVRTGRASGRRSSSRAGSPRGPRASGTNRTTRAAKGVRSSGGS